VIENHKRRSTDGLSLDYLMYSLVGYLCYAAYTGSLYFSPGIQAAYQVAHAGSPPDVQLADFLFAAHAVACTCYTIYQCLQYGSSSSSGGSSLSADSRSPGSSRKQQQQQLSPWAVGTGAVVLASILGYSQHIHNTCDTSDCASWLPLLAYLGLIKVSMTLIKYTPQAWMNFKRRSTDGWQINNVLLDLLGGVLSFTQIGVDAMARHDLSVVTGNPAKLGIAAISIAFDLLFIAQHYVLYPQQPAAGAATQGSSARSEQQQQQSLGGAQQQRAAAGVTPQRQVSLPAARGVLRVPGVSAVVGAVGARRWLQRR
jgi:cystinosin